VRGTARRGRGAFGEMVKLIKPVVLVGMMGAGKSAVGRELATRLGVPFRDSDAEIERAAAMTIPEIFARDGEPFFRDREAQVITRLLEGPPSVLAVGGGAFLRAETRDRIRARGAALWLKADLDLLWARVRRKENRPLLKTADPLGTLRALMAAREPVYALADLVVEVRPEAAIEATAEQVRTALAARADLLT
jgi:shikimate kinase